MRLPNKIRRAGTYLSSLLIALKDFLRRSEGRKVLLPALGVLIGLLYIGLYRTPQDYSAYGNRVEQIKIGNRTFQVEIVDTEEKRRQGLSGREDLCLNCGMLFEFDNPENYVFWMKGMEFPLDMIWIDGNEIVKIREEVPIRPVVGIDPGVRADKVLEINAGLSKKYGIREGDTVFFIDK